MLILAYKTEVCSVFWNSLLLCYYLQAERWGPGKVLIWISETDRFREKKSRMLGYYLSTSVYRNLLLNNKGFIWEHNFLIGKRGKNIRLFALFILDIGRVCFCSSSWDWFHLAIYVDKQPLSSSLCFVINWITGSAWEAEDLQVHFSKWWSFELFRALSWVGLLMSSRAK